MIRKYINQYSWYRLHFMAHPLCVLQHLPRPHFVSPSCHKVMWRRWCGVDLLQPSERQPQHGSLSTQNTMFCGSLPKNSLKKMDNYLCSKKLSRSQPSKYVQIISCSIEAPYLWHHLKLRRMGLSSSRYMTWSTSPFAKKRLLKTDLSWLVPENINKIKQNN